VSGQRDLQALAPSAEQDARALNVSDRSLQFEVIPNVCTIADVCRILQISERKFFYLMVRKDLALVELRRVGRVRRFTGESVRFEARRRE
jgi:hypothetical protein